MAPKADKVIEGTVADVTNYAADHPDEVAAIVAAEEASDKPRKGVTKLSAPFEDETPEIDPELEPDKPEVVNLATAEEDVAWRAFSVSHVDASYDITEVQEKLDEEFGLSESYLVSGCDDRIDRTAEILSNFSGLVLVAGWMMNTECNIDLLVARIHGIPVFEFNGGNLSRSLATPHMVQIQNNIARAAFPLNQ